MTATTFSLICIIITLLFEIISFIYMYINNCRQLALHIAFKKALFGMSFPGLAEDSRWFGVVKS